LATLVLVTGGDAQPPGKKGKKGGPGQRLTTEQIVERILSFDKNGDGKLTKDELPERMQYLFEKGDANKDGVLDKEEIRNLATTLSQDGFGFGGRGGDLAPFAQAGGKGKGGKGGKGKGGFGGGFGPRGGAERALASLSLSGPTKEKAEAVVKSHEEAVRKLLEMAR
jgi:hypothetical protein